MCLSPRYGMLQTKKVEYTGEIKKKMFFLQKERWTYLKEQYESQEPNPNKILDFYTLPCGKCPECCQEYSSQWSFRIMNEAQYHKDNCFITLTYANTDEELHKRDVQLFIKRLRRHIEPQRLRFFSCGEYGSKKQRPHYHVILFGYVPPDLVFFKRTEKGSELFLSKTLEKLWPYGFVSVCELTINDAKYTAKYMQKLIDYSDKDQKPYICASNRPGIGYQYCMDHKEDLALTDKLVYKGSFCKLPRYYLRLLESNDIDITSLRANREKKRELIYDNPEVMKNRRLKYNTLFHIEFDNLDKYRYNKDV